MKSHEVYSFWWHSTQNMVVTKKISSTKVDAMDQRHSAIFQFETNFGRIDMNIKMDSLRKVVWYWQYLFNWYSLAVTHIFTNLTWKSCAGKAALALKRSCNFSRAKIERISTVARHVLLHNLSSARRGWKYLLSQSTGTGIIEKVCI